MQASPSRYRIYGGFVNYRKSIAEFLNSSWLRGSGIEELEELMSIEFGKRSQDFPRSLTATGSESRVGSNQPMAAIAVPLARVGIYLVVKHLIKPGQKVLMSPYTIADVVNMVIAAGGIPKFIDVEGDSGNMCAESLRNNFCLESGAVLVTHLHGIPANMPEILSIAREKGVPVIEDNAQSLGAVTELGKAGAISEAGIFSFGSYKNINAWFGGMVLTRNSELARKIRLELEEWPYFPRRHLFRKIRESAMVDIMGWGPIFRTVVGRFFHYGFTHDVSWINRLVAIELDTSRRDQLVPWFKSRMTPGQARRVLEQWPLLEEHTDLRIQKAEIYHRHIPEFAGFTKPPAPAGKRNVYTYYPLQVRNRVNLLKWLQYFRRDIAPQHLKNCAHLDSFRDFYRPCPVAEKVANSLILLPTYPSYANEDVLINVNLINWYVDNGEPEFSNSVSQEFRTKAIQIENTISRV